jgi:hypothetical protein
MKKNFAYGTKVQINRTGSSPLDEMVGVIAGIASRDFTDFYIVDLGQPFSFGGDQPHTFHAIVMVESCLDEISGLSSD